MKTTKLILLLAFTALFANCGKPECESQEPGNILSLEERVQAAVAWNDFKNAADDNLNATQNEIDALRGKIYLATARDKVKIRRIINKNEYQLDKLRKSLYDHDVWFEKNINTYSDKNAEKIDAFKNDFQAKLNDINAEIDDCNC